MHALSRLLLVFSVALWPAFAADDLRLETFAYPFPVQIFKLKNQRQELEMAYMDLEPERTPSGTIVLLHGKNFSGAYWQEINLQALSQQSQFLSISA